MNTLERAPAETETPARLARPEFWGIFAFTVAIFLFGHGPIWQHPWTIGALNDAILWSYLPIPPLVAIALAARRRLGARAFFLDALELTLLKYATTFGFALVLWGAHDPPPLLGDVPEHAIRAPRVEPPPRPTPIPTDRRGSLEGRVEGPDGEPIAGAIVWIDGGLAGLVFEPPARPVHLENDGEEILPRLAAAMVGEPIDARSSDGRMHTLVATAGGATVFNVPLLPSGVARPVEVKEAHGPMELRCTVHKDEAHARLVLVANPFFATTDAGGMFRLEGVPAASVTVAAAREDGSIARAEAAIEGRRATTVAVRFPRL